MTSLVLIKINCCYLFIPAGNTLQWWWDCFLPNDSSHQRLVGGNSIFSCLACGGAELAEHLCTILTPFGNKMKLRKDQRATKFLLVGMKSTVSIAAAVPA